MTLKGFFEACPRPSTPLSEEDMEMLAKLLLSKGRDEPLSYAEFMDHPLVKQEKAEGKELPTALIAVWTRVNRVDGYFKMSLNAALFISSFVRSFGDSTLYMSYVMLNAHEHGIRDITLSYVAEHVFPWGVFDQEQLSMMWDLQKNNSSPAGNLLDENSEWRKHLLGNDAENKVVVKFGDEDERPLTIEEFEKCGRIKEPNEIEGRMFFWLGNSYVSTSKEDFQKITE